MPITLPGKSSPCTRLQDFSWFFYGARKIGKTQTFSEFEDPFFFMFEPGGKALSIKQLFCPKWETALEVLQAIEQKKGYCKTIVIDTGYMAYERCFEYSLKRLGIIKPGDKNWGTAWKFIDKEFRDFHMRLYNLGVSICATAHSEVKEIERKDGTKFSTLSTQLSAQAARYYLGTMDVIGYVHKNDEGDRVITLQSDGFVEDAGHRIEGHFLYKGTNKPISEISMGKNKKEGYANLVKAFNNEIEDPTRIVKTASAKIARR